jgi:WD40 repeat protein
LAPPHRPQPETPVDRTQTLAPKSDRGAKDTTAVDPTVRAPAPSAAPGPALAVDDPDRYRADGEHARGGLGRIVRAEDTRLGRTVAVKELLRASPGAEALFVREALITARLQHPGIVPVHEAGRWPSGEPYYVMKLVQGRTLKEVIAEKTCLADRLALLPHAIAVAEAIGYAHSRGVIHRDVKPANVMVGDFGETVVVDWGLARDDARPEPEIESGRVIGTPQYMPPEQARGEGVDARADVYALGALLYETLAGRAPYVGDDPQAVLEAVTAGPPRRLAQVAPGVPRDLDAIVGKAMARDPRNRYANGKDLAEDVKRFQSGQLVSAHSYSRAALALRWIGRHRGPVAIVAGALAIVTFAAVWSFESVVEERNVARAATEQTKVALGAAENRQHQLTMLQAKRSLAQDPTAVIAWLKAYPQGELSDPEIPAMIDEAVAGGVARHVWRQREWVRGVAFSPDGRALATASQDGDVRVYEVASGAMHVIGKHDAGVGAVAWSPDGRLLAAGGADGELAVWDVAGGAARVIGKQPESIGALAWSKDGARLLSKTERGEPRVWDVARGGNRQLLVLDEAMMAIGVPQDDWDHALAAGASGAIWRANGAAPPAKIATVPGGVAAIGASPDGARAIVSDGRALWRLEVASGALVRVGDAMPMIKSFAWSPDGAQVAIGGEDPDISLVDLRAGSTRRLRGHTDALYDLHFSRDGRRLLSASDDGTARVWDLTAGGSRVLRGHTDDVIRAAFSPREDLVATASLDGSARLWQLDRQEDAIWDGAGATERLAFLDGGKRVVALAYPARATAYEVADGARTRLAAADAATSSATPRVPIVSLDGRWVAVVRDDGTLAVWHDGAGPDVLDGHDGWIAEAAFSPRGGVAYTAASNGTVRAWDVVARTSRVVFKGDGAWALTVSPDGARLAIGDGTHVVLVDRDGVELARATIGAPPGKGCSRGIGFDASGARLAIGRCDGPVLVWTPARGAPRALDASSREIVQFAFSPDGARLAGAMGDRTVRVWDATTGRITATLGGHTDLVMAVAWSPDGRRLASASYDRTIRVWDPVTGASRVLRGHDGSVDAIAWTPDGARLLSGSRDGTVRTWRAPSLAPPAAADVRASLDRVTTAEIARDDRPATPMDTTPGG